MQENLGNTISSLSAISPEIALSVGIVLILLSGLVTQNKKALLNWLIGLATLMADGFFLAISNPSGEVKQLFGGMLQTDDFSFYIRLLSCCGGLLALILWLAEGDKKSSSEFFALVCCVVLGSQILVMSNNLLMVVLAFELISISSYVLAGFSFNAKSAEGSLKYFLYGAIATAIMIYGISWIYGLAGTVQFSSPDFAFRLVDNPSPLLLTAGCLVIAGYLFKMATTPFHLWAPDVYEASPWPVVALFSSVPKLASAGALIKLLLALHLFGKSSIDWQSIITVIALLTLFAGNLSALWQRDPRRLMAYSSVAQSGFLLAGVAIFSITGVQVFLFYASVLMVMNFLAFHTLQNFSKRFPVNTITDFSGLGRQDLVMGISLLIAMISLVGIPITGGFMAKLFIFTGLWESYTETGKEVILWLFILGLLNTVLSLFYYLKIPFYLFMKEKPGLHQPRKNFSFVNLFASILVILLLWLFFQPGLLMGWINRITFVL